MTVTEKNWNGLSGTPGWVVWLRGGTRQQMQEANNKAGRPCYCASLWSGACDMCSGLAGEDRWTRLYDEQIGGAK